MKRKAKRSQVVKALIDVINKGNLSSNDLIKVLIQFLFSLGASKEKVQGLSADEILKRYAIKPSLGYALMAQALYMRAGWVDNKSTVAYNSSKKKGSTNDGTN